MSVFIGGLKNLKKEYTDKLVELEKPDAVKSSAFVLSGGSFTDDRFGSLRKIHHATERLSLAENMLHVYARDYNVIDEHIEHRSKCVVCLRALSEEPPYAHTVRGVVSLDCHHMFHAACVRELEEDNSSRNRRDQRAAKCPKCSKPFRMFVSFSWDTSTLNRMGDEEIIFHVDLRHPSFHSEKTLLLMIFIQTKRYALIEHMLTAYKCTRCASIEMFDAAEYDERIYEMLVDAKMDCASFGTALLSKVAGHANIVTILTRAGFNSVFIGAPKNPYVDHDEEFTSIENTDHDESTDGFVRRMNARLKIVEKVLNTYESDYNAIEDTYEHRSICTVCNRRLDEDSPFETTVRGVCSLDCHHVFHSACIHAMEAQNDEDSRLTGKAPVCPISTCAKPFRMFYPIPTRPGDKEANHIYFGVYKLVENKSDEEIIAALPVLCPSFDIDKTRLLKLFTLRRRRNLIGFMLDAYDCARCVTFDVFDNAWHDDIFEILIAAKTGDVALLSCAAIRAAYSRCGDTMKILNMFFKAGVDPKAVDEDGTNILMSAVCNGSRLFKEIMKLGIDVNAIDCKGDSVLSISISHTVNHLQIEALIKAGADVNISSSKCSPLLGRAIQNSSGDEYIPKRMISAGADVNVISLYLIGDTYRLYSPLGYAARRLYKRIFKSLINARSDVNLKMCFGRTALMFAANHDNSYRDTPETMVNTLIDAGADVNAYDDNSMTALMFATEQRNAQVVKCLIESGADIWIKNNKGRTALEMPTSPEVTDLLMVASSEQPHKRTRFFGVKF